MHVNLKMVTDFLKETKNSEADVKFALVMSHPDMTEYIEIPINPSSAKRVCTECYCDEAEVVSKKWGFDKDKLIFGEFTDQATSASIENTQ